MQMLALVWGILAMAGFAVGMIPCLGSLNWINIPFAIIGVIVSLLARSSAPAYGRGPANVGLVLNVIAAVIGFVRLKAGLFIF
jgi:hypothetical protein